MPALALQGTVVLPGTTRTVTIDGEAQMAEFKRAIERLPIFVLLAPERPDDLLAAGFEGV